MATRISTGAQDLGSQVTHLKAVGYSIVLRGKTSGVTAERIQVKRLMKVITPGDVVVIPAVDRLSREPPHSRTNGTKPSRYERKGCKIRTQAEAYGAPAEGSMGAAGKWRDVTQRGAQLQRQSGDT